MLLLNERHQTLIKEIENFQSDLKIYILSFRDGFEAGATVHDIEKADPKINSLLTELQNSLKLTIDVDRIKIGEDDTVKDYLWIKYTAYNKTYYFRHLYDSKSYENFDERKLAGVLMKFSSNVSTLLCKLRTRTDTLTFYDYKVRLEKIFDAYLLG